MASSSESSVAASPLPAVPVDFNSLLELNLAYQDLIRNLLRELEALKIENNQLQQEAAEILVIQGRNPKVASRSFRFPYFVDNNERVPPVSEDKHVKDALGIRPLVPVKKWTEKEYLTLQEAVFVSVKRSVLSRLLMKKDSLEKRVAALDDSTSRSLLEDVETELSELEGLNKMKLLTKYSDERVDWLCISVTDFAGRRSDIELEQMWHNYIWPNVGKPPWDTESIQKLEGLLRESPGAPDWEVVAEKCDKHVYQCWELSVQNSPHTKPLKVSDAELVLLYTSLRQQDFVPWVKLADILQFTAPSKAMRRVDKVLCSTHRKTWTLEEDVLLFLALYLYRGPSSAKFVLKCVAVQDSPRTPSQCFGRLDHLLGTVSFGNATKVIEAYRVLPRLMIPRIRKKAAMVSWLLSTLMSIVDRVRLACFLNDEPHRELQRMAPRIAKNCFDMLHCKRRAIESDTMDFIISKFVTPAQTSRKPTVVPGIKTIHKLMLPVIEKNILRLDPVTPVDKNVLNRSEKVYAALNRITRHNLLPPCSIMVEPTNGLVRRAATDLDPSIVEWIEDKLKNSPSFRVFEQAFQSLFALSMIAAEVELPEVKQLRPAKEFDRTRKGITFKRKRACKKPWIKARWKRFRAMKAKKGQSNNPDEDEEGEEQNEDLDQQQQQT